MVEEEHEDADVYEANMSMDEDTVTQLANLSESVDGSEIIFIIDFNNVINASVLPVMHIIGFTGAWMDEKEAS